MVLKSSLFMLNNFELLSENQPVHHWLQGEEDEVAFVTYTL